MCFCINIRRKPTVGNLNHALRSSFVRPVYTRNSIHSSPIYGCIQNRENTREQVRSVRRNYATARRGDCVSANRSAGDETLCREDKLGSVVRLSSACYARKICTKWKIESEFSRPCPRILFFRSLLGNAGGIFYRGVTSSFKRRLFVEYRSGASSSVIFCSQQMISI